MNKLSALELSREIERMVTHDVTIPQIDIALVLLERLGEKLKLDQAAHPKQPCFIEAVHADSISLIAAEYRNHFKFTADEESDMPTCL